MTPASAKTAKMHAYFFVWWVLNPRWARDFRQHVLQLTETRAVEKWPQTTSCYIYQNLKRGVHLMCQKSLKQPVCCKSLATNLAIGRGLQNSAKCFNEIEKYCPLSCTTLVAANSWYFLQSYLAIKNLNRYFRNSMLETLSIRWWQRMTWWCCPTSDRMTLYHPSPWKYPT